MKLSVIVNDSVERKDMQYIDNVVQDNRIKLGDFEWIASSGVRISSAGFPEIVITNPSTLDEKITIFIKGTDEEDRNKYHYFNKLTRHQVFKINQAIEEFNQYEPFNKASLEPSVNTSIEAKEIKPLSEVLIPLLNNYKSNLDEIKKCFPNIDLSDIETLTVKSFTEILEITQDYIEWDSTTVSYDSIHFRDCLIVVVAGDHLIIVTSPDKFNEE